MKGKPLRIGRKYERVIGIKQGLPIMAVSYTYTKEQIESAVLWRNNLKETEWKSICPSCQQKDVRMLQDTSNNKAIVIGCSSCATNKAFNISQRFP